MYFEVIAALSTAPAPSGIAVLRVSGEGCGGLIPKIFRSSEDPLELPRQLIYGSYIKPDTSEQLDKGLLVFLPADRSYTGEESFEVHLHGSMQIVRELLQALYSVGARPALPGEFTKRAFLNGKLDLVQAEAVHELIIGSSEESRKIALEQLNGRLSTAIQDLGEPLRDLLAEIEAGVDFPEEDIEPETLDRLRNTVMSTAKRVSQFIESYSYGEAVKEGFRVLLCGAPNAGKSSLLNQLLGTNRAIVTEIAGTTRDLIEERAVIREHAFIFCDSAGITDSSDTVERIGVELARERIGWADLVLLLVDGSSRNDSWRSILSELEGRSKSIWVLVNKVDQPLTSQLKENLKGIKSEQISISALNGTGLEELKNRLVEEVESRLPLNMERSVVVTNARHRACLVRANDALNKTVEALDAGQPAEIISAELRIALSALEEIVGKTWNEDILGRIFSKFCIGK